VTLGLEALRPTSTALRVLRLGQKSQVRLDPTAGALYYPTRDSTLRLQADCEWRALRATVAKTFAITVRRNAMKHYRRVVQRIREEFEEIPGLRLTVREASRFWGLEESTCELVLAELAMDGFLAQGVDNRFQVYMQA
jgi:hypothetical protein